MKRITINKWKVKKMNDLVNEVNDKLGEVSRRIKVGSDNLDRSVRNILTEINKVKIIVKGNSDRLTKLDTRFTKFEDKVDNRFNTLEGKIDMLLNHFNIPDDKQKPSEEG